MNKDHLFIKIKNIEFSRIIIVIIRIMDALLIKQHFNHNLVLFIYNYQYFN